MIQERRASGSCGCGRPAGYTVVELIVTILIIGGLISIALPAVQCAREAARQLACQSNVRQLALACLAAESRSGHFPSGGWGWSWVGDPDLGKGSQQPGSWAYNILPFLEAGLVHRLPADSRPEVITASQRRGAAAALATSATGFNCPSRRAAKLLPARPSLFNSAPPPGGRAAKADYAINAGDGPFEGPHGRGQGEGPPPGALRFIDQYPWWWREGGHARPESRFSGLSFVCSQVRSKSVSDGLSKTYLLGEKYLDPDAALKGTDRGDNENYLSGFDNDNTRSTQSPPLMDRRGVSFWDRFGSPHAGSLGMAFADGSVRRISYDVDPRVHRAAGNRADGH